MRSDMMLTPGCYELRFPHFLISNQNVATFDERPNSKREEVATLLFLYMQYSTQMVTNYKGFERYLLVSENQLRENHENRLENQYFAMCTTEQ